MRSWSLLISVIRWVLSRPCRMVRSCLLTCQRREHLSPEFGSFCASWDRVNSVAPPAGVRAFDLSQSTGLGLRTFRVWWVSLGGANAVWCWRCRGDFLSCA